MTIFCTNCGIKLDEGFSFCINCGTKVDNLFNKEKTNERRKENQKKKLIEEILESKEIKLKIKEYNINESQLNNIKTRVMKIENCDDNEIKENIMVRIDKICNLNKVLQERSIVEKRKKIIEEKFEKNPSLYVEEKIKKFDKDIILASFEKKYINFNSRKLDENAYHNKIKLNQMAKEFINKHKKIGKYDFAGQLIEETGFTNKVDGIDLRRRMRKDSDHLSNVFVKIFEDKIKIVGSEIVPIYLGGFLTQTPKYKGVVGKDRTIFFNDIIGISHSGEEIHLNLSNNEKLILKGTKSGMDNENIELFYNTLNSAWEKFKNKESEQHIQIKEKDETSGANELMKCAELYEKGLLTEEEFNATKKKLLGL